MATQAVTKLGTWMVFLMLGSGACWAAIPPVHQQVLSKPGSIAGGEAGSGFSILNLELVSRPNKTERLVIDVGDFEGKPHLGKPGYFHVEKKSNHMVSVDFAQMGLTKVTQEQLDQALKKSKLLQQGRITYDSLDQTMNLSLTPKKNVQVKTYQVIGKNQTSKVVIDLIE